jgi:transposase
MAMKYDADFKERTCRHIQESGKSATSVAEELGVDKNSVCAWMRQYRRRNHLPSHEEVKVAKKQTQAVQRTKAETKQLRADQKRIVELEERVEILKKLCISSCKPRNEV